MTLVYDDVTLQHSTTLQRLHVDVTKQLCCPTYNGKNVFASQLGKDARKRCYFRCCGERTGRADRKFSQLHKASARFSKLVNSASGCAKNPGYGVPSRFM